LGRRPNARQVVGIETATNAVVAKVDSSATCGEIGVFDETVWISNCFDSSDVEVIDAVTGVSHGAIEPGDIAGTPLEIGGLVWVSTIQLGPGSPGRLVGIDPTTLEIVDTVTTEHDAYIAGQGFDSVWQFSYWAGAVIRLPLDAFAGGP
jgi:hypothetical protein